MPHRGTRKYKMFVWWSKWRRIKSYSTYEKAMQAFNNLPHKEKVYADVWYEENKQTSKSFIVRSGKLVSK